MFKYENDICEYIRTSMNGIPKLDEKLAFKKYLNKNNLVLINKKTLSIVNTLEEVDALQEGLRSEEYCQYNSCIGESDITCIICILDYMLNIGYLKLIENEDKHA